MGHLLFYRLVTVAYFASTGTCALLCSAPTTALGSCLTATSTAGVCAVAEGQNGGVLEEYYSIGVVASKVNKALRKILISIASMYTAPQAASGFTLLST